VRFSRNPAANRLCYHTVIFRVGRRNGAFRVSWPTVAARYVNGQTKSAKNPQAKRVSFQPGPKAKKFRATQFFLISVILVRVFLRLLVWAATTLRFPLDPFAQPPF
jgi:hypothetical protein